MAVGETARLIASLELGKNTLTPGIAGAIGSVGKLEGKLGTLGSRASGAFKTVGALGVAIGAVAAGVIAKGVFEGVRSLEDLERVTNATEGVIKSTGSAAGVTAQQVRDLAQSLEGVTTVDDKVIQGGENLLLTFTGIGKDVFPAATKAMTDMAIAMAEGDVSQVDLKASAVQLGKALNDPIRGMTALRKVGVSFTKDQEDQIKTLVKSGDVMGAQKLILAELEKEFGQAGKAAGTGTAADVRRFQDAIEDAQQALAVGFLPIIKKVADFLQRKLADPKTLQMIRDFGQRLADGFDRLLTAAQKIPWGTIGEGLKTAATWAGKLFDAFLHLPPEFQTTIVALAGLNKLSGGAVSGIVGKLGEGLIKGVLGMNAGVVNINAGVVNGGGLPGGKGGPGLIGTAAKIAIPVAIVAAGIEAGVAITGINEARHQIFDEKTGQLRTVRTNLTPDQIKLNQTLAELAAAARGGDQTAADQLRALLDIKHNGGDVLSAIKNGPPRTTGGLSPDDRAGIPKINAATGFRTNLAESTAATAAHAIKSSIFTTSLADLIAGIRKRSAARFGGTGLGPAAVDATFQRDILRAAKEVASSSAGLGTKVADLKTLQSLLTQNGDTETAKKVQALIDSLTPTAIGTAVATATKTAGLSPDERQQLSEQRAAIAKAAAETRYAGQQTAAAIRDKNFTPTVNVSVSTTTSVSIRDTAIKTKTFSRYGNVAS